jgi:hypothetical protein
LQDFDAFLTGGIFHLLQNGTADALASFSLSDEHALHFGALVCAWKIAAATNCAIIQACNKESYTLRL